MLTVRDLKRSHPGELMIDTLGASAVIVKMCKYTRAHCVHVSQGYLLNISKSHESKTKGKWISESGAAVPDETLEEPPFSQLQQK